MTITVYSANKCMQCRFTKEMLEREGVEFSEIMWTITKHIEMMSDN